MNLQLGDRSFPSLPCASGFLWKTFHMKVRADLHENSRSNWEMAFYVIIAWYFSTTRKIQIPLGFPSEHPCTSHMPKFQVFPSLESPDDIRKGKQAVMLQPTLPPTALASAPDSSVLEKTKGHFNRREMVSVQRESERKPLIWPEHNLLQVIPLHLTCIYQPLARRWSIGLSLIHI